MAGMKYSLKTISVLSGMAVHTIRSYAKDLYPERFVNGMTTYFTKDEVGGILNRIAEISSMKNLELQDTYVRGYIQNNPAAGRTPKEALDILDAAQAEYDLIFKTDQVKPDEEELKGSDVKE